MSREDWFWVFDQTAKKTPLAWADIRQIFKDDICQTFDQWVRQRRNALGEKGSETAVYDGLFYSM